MRNGLLQAADEIWWAIRSFMFEFAVPAGLFFGIQLLIMLAFGRMPLP
jgi:hypothetical protein